NWAPPSPGWWAPTPDSRSAKTCAASNNSWKPARSRPPRDSRRAAGSELVAGGRSWPGRRTEYSVLSTQYREAGYRVLGTEQPRQLPLSRSAALSTEYSVLGTQSAPLRRREAAMRAVCWHGKRDVHVATVPDPVLLNPRDAIVRVTSTAICGSDVHLY